MPIALPFGKAPEGERKLDFDLVDRLGAAKDLAEMDTYTATQGLDFGGLLGDDLAFGRDDVLDRLSKESPGNALIDPEEANAKYEFVEQPFDKPVTNLMAEYLNNEGKKRAELQRIISNGGTASSASVLGISLAGGVAASATDPVEAGVDVVMTAATAGIGGLLAKSAKLARTLGKSTQTVSRLNKARNLLSGRKLGALGVFGKEALEGTIANSALEPILAESQQRAQQDYQASDAAISILAGGVGLPALKAGGLQGLKGVQQFSKYISNDPRAVQKALGTASSLIRAGKKPGAFLKHYAEARKNKIHGVNRANLEPGSIRADYRIQPVQDVASTSFYVAGTKPGKYKPESHHVVDNYMGDGLHFTDNPNAANNITQLEENLHAGDVHEINLGDSNILDLDSPINTELGDSFRNKIPEEYRDAFEAGSSLRESFENVKQKANIENDLNPVEAAEVVNGISKELGYDGYRYFDPESGNHGFVFDQGKPSHKQSFKGDSSTVPPSDKQAETALRESILSKEADLDYDAEAVGRIKEAEKLANERAKIVENLPKQRREEYLSRIEQLDQGRDVLDPELVKVTDSLKKLDEFEEISEKGLADYQTCILGGGTP